MTCLFRFFEDATSVVAHGVAFTIRYVNVGDDARPLWIGRKFILRSPNTTITQLHHDPSSEQVS